MAYRLEEIAEVIEADLVGDPDYEISGVATLQNAGAGQLSFLANRRYSRHLKSTRAGAVVLSRDDVDSCPVFSLVATDPYLAFARAVRYLHPDAAVIPGIHHSAVVSDSASVHPGACVGANVCIGDAVIIEEGVYIGPGCIIGNHAVIGKHNRLTGNVSICHGVRTGERVLIHPGVVIGADGFGIAKDAGKWLKVPQLGGVVISDDVEIGANTTIDRGALTDTVIEEGVKIDNQVQIGHNCVIGAYTAIAGCAVIAGSVRIGKRCMIGGATAITGHIEITDDVVITGLSGVTNSIKEPGVYSGAMTTTDNRTWRKNMVRLRHLDELARRVQALEEKLGEKG